MLPACRSVLLYGVLPLPVFPGKDHSEYNIENYFAKNMRYAADAKKLHLTGKVTVSFTVDEKGRIQSPEITIPLYPSMDKEALRLVKSMPAWEPAMKSGKAVSAKWNADAVFRLP